MAKAHELIVDDAVLVWVVHDTTRMCSRQGEEVRSAQHWFQDLTTIWVGVGEPTSVLILEARPGLSRR